MIASSSLSPNKYMDLDKSLLAKTAFVIDLLLKKKAIRFTELLSTFESNFDLNNLDDFLSVLTILYAFGKIKYFDKTDTIYLVNNEI